MTQHNTTVLTFADVDRIDDNTFLIHADTEDDKALAFEVTARNLAGLIRRATTAINDNSEATAMM